MACIVTELTMASGAKYHVTAMDGCRSSTATMARAKGTHIFETTEPMTFIWLNMDLCESAQEVIA